MTLIEQLLAVVLISPCRCEYERNNKGVPIWVSPDGGGEVTRKLIRRCSRCAAIARYELEYIAELDTL